MRKGHARDDTRGDNSVTIAAAGDAGRPEHGRVGDAVAEGVGKGAAASKTV